RLSGPRDRAEPRVVRIVAPFNSQTTHCPVMVLPESMSPRASLLKSWVAAKAPPKKPAAMKLAAQHASMPSSRRNPVELICVSSVYLVGTDGPNAPRTTAPGVTLVKDVRCAQALACMLRNFWNAGETD